MGCGRGHEWSVLGHQASDKLGTEIGVVFHDNDQSPETRAAIDREIQKLLTASYQRAKAILEAHRKDLDLIAKGLIERETMSGHELKSLLEGKLGPVEKQ